MRRVAPLAALLLLAWLTACASKGPPPPDQIQFVDSRMFDDQLHDSLAHGHPAVTVSFAGGDVTINRVPQRIDQWLYLIDKRDDGKVQLVADPDYPMGKGLESLAITLALGAYSYLKERAYYAPIGNYDATVYYVPNEGRLTRVVFSRVAEE